MQQNSSRKGNSKPSHRRLLHMQQIVNHLLKNHIKDISLFSIIWCTAHSGLRQWSNIQENTFIYIVSNVAVKHIQDGPQKLSYHTLSISSLNITNFHNFFTSRLCKKFATHWHAHHTYYVATLPCKT